MPVEACGSRSFLTLELPTDSGATEAPSTPMDSGTTDVVPTPTSNPLFEVVHGRMMTGETLMSNAVADPTCGLRTTRPWHPTALLPCISCRYRPKVLEFPCLMRTNGRAGARTDDGWEGRRHGRAARFWRMILIDRMRSGTLTWSIGGHMQSELRTGTAGGAFARVCAD